jgi:hypothetical protein
VLRLSESAPKKRIKSTEFWYTIKSSVFCSRFSWGTLKARGFCSQGQGLLFMEAPCNGGTVNPEGPSSSGKQKARRACVRRAQRMTRSSAREKRGQNGGADQNSGIGLTCGWQEMDGYVGGIQPLLLAPQREDQGNGGTTGSAWQKKVSRVGPAIRGALRQGEYQESRSPSSALLAPWGNGQTLATSVRLTGLSQLRG